MRVHSHPLLRLVALSVLTAAACEAPQVSPTADPAPAPASGTAPAATPAPSAAPTLAQVRDDVPLPLTRLLGRPVPEVEAELGEQLGKAMQRETCVRLVPERVFFTCKYVLQRYADKTGNFKEVRIAYEDGVATEVSYDGWKHGSGEFTPKALLEAIGLTLPEPGVKSTPAPEVQLWTWFNDKARLLLGGGQYRVELSIVAGDWARTRVEVVLNSRLTPEQQAKIYQGPGPQISEPPATP